MTVQGTSIPPRASARRSRASAFASGPIRGITTEEEALKCHILVALQRACGGKIRTRVPISEVFGVGRLLETDREELMRLVGELDTAKAVYYCEHAQEIRLPYVGSLRRAKEAEMALTLWTKGKRKK